MAKKSKALEQALAKNSKEPVYLLKRKKIEEKNFTYLQKRYIEHQNRTLEAIQKFKKGKLQRNPNKECPKPSAEEIKRAKDSFKNKNNNIISAEIRKKREEILKRQLEKLNIFSQ